MGKIEQVGSGHSFIKEPKKEIKMIVKIINKFGKETAEYWLATM